MINFQGRLTDAGGKFVPDGNYSLTFRIYTDSTEGSAKWTEAQTVPVSKGLFNAILGSITPIPDSIFDYPNTWLGIQDGLDASDFSSPATDYGRSGVATDLYEGINTLTERYVNEGQTNSITSGMITDNQIVDADISGSANISPSKISGTAWTSSNDGTGSGLDADHYLR